ncbi:hypothetical protein FKW77_009276 [Venturia effusa]|uniref:Major facilitator superfamily (MFS) profile domain-containing protein n=1 Tax=Venturia effusa TaxID=50376 RepID=A0A517LGE5_9PEZI|nr:hypothetical protein FKW77_009276 [Venturia effusa]
MPWLFGFRILLGIGIGIRIRIGGDYPLSAAIVAERSTLGSRGRMLAWIFSSQGWRGWGTLAASVVTHILLSIFKSSLTNGHFGHIDAIWRLQIGLALVPCFALLYFRLTMPESRKFIQSTELSTVAQSQSLNNSTDVFDERRAEKDFVGDSSPNRRASVVEAHATVPPKNVQMMAFIDYFSYPKHALILFGRAMSWFLVDVAFYGVNLNPSVILTSIGYSTGKNPYEYLLHNAEGNVIIAIAGYVPGYFLTIVFIELLGRKWIQIQGILVSCLMFGILAGAPHLSSGARFALIVIAQLFLNFDPNATTFIVPGEVFPSRVRGLAHGFCAAVGKCGAILSGIEFIWWSQSDHQKYPQSIALSGVLWIFSAFQIAGAAVTLVCVPETRGVGADAIDYAEMQEKVS